MNEPARNKMILASMLMILAFSSWATDRDSLLEQYSSQGTGQFSAERGQKIWEQSVDGKAPFTLRSCTSCHGKNVKNSGEHLRTKKMINPMALSTNPSSLSKRKNIEKWFKRNCKWTFGRVCSPQEKGDIITYLQAQ
jgi:mono/diheme cytochrome c family protein